MKTRIIIFSLLLCCSCSRHSFYPQNRTWSTEEGKLTDSLRFFFPTSLTFLPPGASHDTLLAPPLDSNFSLLYAGPAVIAGEPVLYNFYLGHDIYRFIWWGSFDPARIISLHHDGSSVWLTTKVLSQTFPSFASPFEVYFRQEFKMRPPPILGELVDSVSETDDSLVTWKDGRGLSRPKTKVALSTTHKLSLTEWEEFERLLQRCRFWSMYPDDGQIGLDGAHWILEVHLRDRYWLVDRFSPEAGTFRACADYLARLSGLTTHFY